jgi:allantoate deiminase
MDIALDIPAGGLDIEELGRRAEAMIQQLGAISAEPDRLTRLFLTPEHRRAADQVAAWMREAGLSVSEDALGTVRGRLEGGSTRLLIGSHIDTVIGAGRYDGVFGVVAGILAVERFSKTVKKLPFGIDILAFGDEEGSRFPTTLSSSAAVAGIFRREWLSQAGRGGQTYAEALAGYGKDVRAIAGAAYQRGEAAAYVEVHIEQGPVLEARNQPLGVVTAIVGQTYLSVQVHGVAGHAGTVPMHLRHDALAGAAEMAAVAETMAVETNGQVVATVGKLTVEPNASNVIPSLVSFVLDLRSSDDTARASFAEAFRSNIEKIASARGLKLSVTKSREARTTPCDPRLQELLAKSIVGVGGEAIRLPSGAGHDGQAMAKLCPVAMMFVRCRGGISHNSAEYASPRDMGTAVAALIDFIGRFELEALA